MASMKDISLACGVSIATVSKALNDHSDIGEETKKRIKEAARELGYFPNSQARALKTNRTNNIGVLFVDEANSGLTHNYFSYVLDSFKRAVEEMGYDITFINSSDKGRNRLSILEHCRYRGFDGVMIACVNFEDSQVKELVESDIPVVTIDYLYENSSCVISNNEKGMRELASYVCSKGHKRIAYLHGADSMVTRQRMDSFYTIMKENGIEIPDEYMGEVAYRDIGKATEETRRLLESENPPTCILYPDDMCCLGGMRAIREKGLRIPEDISIAGYDGILFGRHIEPKLTTIVQNTKELGSRAAKRLISMIENPEARMEEPITVEGKLDTGGSVGCPRQF